MPVSLRHRSLSRDTQRTSYPPPRSPSPPSQTFHPSIILPTPALVESVAGGAHYAGVRVDSDAVLKHRRDSSARKHTELGHHHEPILDDLTELYCGRPTLEIFERFDEYAARPKLVTHSEQLSKRIMSSTDNPNQFIYFQTQEYTIRFLKKKKTVESDEKIIRLTDKWSGNALPTRYGASFLRILSAKKPAYANLPGFLSCMPPNKVS
ncbi:hypothetical protein BJ912DRAFT_945501 [Pholiota molesta]|nr:hypothetical protein BJ912DRAFT_945501 [Pholiota molesta]